MTKTIPSAEDLLQEVLANGQVTDVNELHSRTWQLMIRYRSKYYENRVESFLKALDLPDDIYLKVKTKMLEPVLVEGKEYSNFMEEVSRRVSQAFQPVSGNLAELCAEHELRKVGLVKNIHYTRKTERTDIIIIYHSQVLGFQKRHRIEVKNVSLRERATRGLAFDGDSLFGFFNQPRELTKSNVEILDALCKKTGGYCYLPPDTLVHLDYKGERFKPNTQFSSDVEHFVQNGKFP